MFGAISEKFSTFDMQIDFAIPPISYFRRWLREFFFPFSKLRISYRFINQFVRKTPKKLFGHFTTVPNLALFLQRTSALILLLNILLQHLLQSLINPDY